MCSSPAIGRFRAAFALIGDRIKNEDNVNHRKQNKTKRSEKDRWWDWYHLGSAGDTCGRRVAWSRCPWAVRVRGAGTWAGTGGCSRCCWEPGCLRMGWRWSWRTYREVKRFPFTCFSGKIFSFFKFNGRLKLRDWVQRSPDWRSSRAMFSGIHYPAHVTFHGRVGTVSGLPLPRRLHK